MSDDEKVIPLYEDCDGEDGTSQALFDLEDCQLAASILRSIMTDRLNPASARVQAAEALLRLALT